MPSPAATKASDKQKACKKLTALLQKDYGKSVPSIDLPVLQTMLFATCLEDNSWSATQEGYDRLQRSYFDLNEIRVSSVKEIEQTLSNLQHADWKGLRIRSILRFVFESTYTFDYEKLKRLTQDSAQKRLKKIDHMSPFIRNFTVQQSLGGYILCLDQIMTKAAIHLGIVPPGYSEEAAGEFLRPGVRKADTAAFAWLLRCLATDPRYAGRFDDPPDEEDKFDVTQVEARFQDLKRPPKRKKKKPAPVEKKPTTAVKKSAAISRSKTSSSAKKSASKPTSKKSTPKKAPIGKKHMPTAGAKKKAAKKSSTAKRKTASKAPAGKKAVRKAEKKKPARKKK